MGEFRKRQMVWWHVSSASRPTWIPKARAEQSAEIKDIDGDLIMITVLNEGRREKTYNPRPRGYNYG